MVPYDFHWLAKARARARWWFQSRYDTPALGGSLRFPLAGEGKGEGQMVVHYVFHLLARSMR